MSDSLRCRVCGLGPEQSDHEEQAPTIRAHAFEPRIPCEARPIPKPCEELVVVKRPREARHERRLALALLGLMASCDGAIRGFR